VGKFIPRKFVGYEWQGSHGDPQFDGAEDEVKLGKSRPEIIIVSFKASSELIRKVDDVAFDLGITRSEAIREALRIYVEMHGVKPRKKIKVRRYVLW